jgi:hypothetical protein
MYGNIVLASTKGQFLPNAIKWFTKSVFSHSLVTVPDVLGVPMCIEAAETGVDFTRFDTGYIDNQDQGYEVWNIKIDQEIKDNAIISILSDLEISYGFFDYPFFIWRSICLLFGKDIKSQNNWISQGMICSQLCVSYLNACELSYIFAGYGSGSVTPQDLQNIFKIHPELFEKTASVRLAV